LINFSAISSETLAGKIARYPLRIIPRGIALPILYGPLRGRKWIVGSFLHRCWLGGYELEFQRRLAAEIKPGGVFYDIGANVGFYSLLASTLIGSGRVYAFEPLPANLGYLRKHLELNRLRNVEVLEMAISDKCGTASFATESSGGMGYLEPDGNLSVAIATLDALVLAGRIAPPDYIKMDIEGGEFGALLGGRECFSRFKPVLFLATHGEKVHDDCCRLLDSWDYEMQTVRRPAYDRAEVMARPRVSIPV
jgi:FkbM family methyltransferase